MGLTKDLLQDQGSFYVLARFYLFHIFFIFLNIFPGRKCTMAHLKSLNLNIGSFFCPLFNEIVATFFSFSISWIHGRLSLPTPDLLMANGYCLMLNLLFYTLLVFSLSRLLILILILF